jgi:hypothetical protein
MSAEETEDEEPENGWIGRFHDMIVNSPLKREDLLEILNEPWTVEDYMEAVSGVGRGYYYKGAQINRGKTGCVDGRSRMELVNSLIIEFLKTGTIESHWY